METVTSVVRRDRFTIELKASVALPGTRIARMEVNATDVSLLDFDNHSRRVHFVGIMNSFAKLTCPPLQKGGYGAGSTKLYVPVEDYQSICVVVRSCRL